MTIPIHQPLPRTGLLARLGRESAFLLASFPLAIVAFVVAVTGVALGAGLLIIFVGLFVVAGTLFVAQGLGDLERRRFAAVGRPLPPTQPFRREKRGLARVLARLRHGQSWLDLLHAFLRFPVSTFTFVLLVTWWSVALGGLTYVVWEQFLPVDNTSLADLLGYPGRTADVVLSTAVGLVFLLLLPFVVRAAFALEHGLAYATLGATHAARLREQVDALSSSRSAAVDAEADTLGRIERDLHDGPQQRLLRTSMDLQAAQRRLAENDTPAARELVDQAVLQVQESVAELRALSRGIAPPVLADRGLEAALSAAAAQSPIPVRLRVDLDGERLLRPRENAAYFLVVEALTNAAKHSGAGEIDVEVTRSGDVVTVTVADDGDGGAHLGKGHGLSGLADRLAGLDGTLEVRSPDGGGTVVTGRIPVGR
ncbi:sensor histidine kinase [Georgenia subflava]|uniref:histidine kinase n=2 Tax=Georgenia subflava TaxID=1622177 RepID=A0A6N7EGI4_9MICO|nr:sensor histidine kinase [Georgenia subflava]